MELPVGIEADEGVRAEAGVDDLAAQDRQAVGSA